MTYVIYRLKSSDTGRAYIGYETTESDHDSMINDLIAAMRKVSDKYYDPQEHFYHDYLRQNVPENELWKSLRGFMDAFNTIENGYNTEEEYEKVSAQIIKQNLKAATQNQVDSSEEQTCTISLLNNVTTEPAISLTKSNLISLAAENGLSSDAVILYLYLNTIPENQFNDLTLEQAAKDLDLTDGAIDKAYDELMRADFVEESYFFQVKEI